tara:strand:- start:242 stop:463 length:222 start_codon:yes stop_codon:yes gene_type:complete
MKQLEIMTKDGLVYYATDEDLVKIVNPKNKKSVSVSIATIWEYLKDYTLEDGSLLGSSVDEVFNKIIKKAKIL